jgi:predicted nucleic acid-binding protein
LKGYVLDASVAVKWFLLPSQETLTREALKLLRDLENGRVRLVVPDLFWSEIGNVFWKAVRANRFPARAAAEAIQALRELNIPTVSCSELVSDAFLIALESSHAVCDCIYVALAVASALPLLTADERLAQHLSPRFPVRWLGSFEAL